MDVTHHGRNHDLPLRWLSFAGWLTPGYVNNHDPGDQFLQPLESNLTVQRDLDV